jgi:hypothetical protein
VRVTHPFHPLAGRAFEFVEARQNWGEDRVVLHDEHGAVFSLPTGWTDAGAVDPVLAENLIRPGGSWFGVSVISPLGA